jgi:hypothetical protein
MNIEQDLRFKTTAIFHTKKRFPFRQSKWTKYRIFSITKYRNFSIFMECFLIEKVNTFDIIKMRGTLQHILLNI